MRFVQSIEVALEQLKKYLEDFGGQIIICLSCEKNNGELLEIFEKQLVDNKIVIKNPSKEDREEIIKFVFNNEIRIGSNH